MPDTNQITNTELVQEVRNKLQLYTDNILKEDSALPPQNKIVYSAINELKTGLIKLRNEFDSKITQLENPDEANVDNIYKHVQDLEKTLTQLITEKLNFLSESLSSEVDRSKKVESGLSDRIDTEKERLDTFFSAAAIGDETIDTLKEIQKWINEDETGTSALVNRVGNIEGNLATEISERTQAVEDLDTKHKAADTEINNKLANVSDRVEFLEREVVLISCGKSKF